MIDFTSVKSLFIPEGEVDCVLNSSGYLWKKEYPYEKLKYIEFDGSLAFDTGLHCNLETKIECKWQRTNTTGSKYLYGVTSSDNSATVTAYLTSSGNWRFGNKAKTVAAGNTNVNTSVHSKTGIKMNGGNNAYTTVSSEFTTPGTIILGGNRASSGNISTSFIGNIYYFKVWDGENLVADWIPAIVDGVYGFWDNVTNSFIEQIEKYNISNTVIPEENESQLY